MSKTSDFSCPLCGAGRNIQKIKADEVYGGAKNQKFWQCGNCDAIYLYPETSDRDDMSFYEKEFDKWMIKRSNDDSWTNPSVQFEKMQKRELPLRMPWFKKLIKPGQRIIEVGSSSGFVLTVLKEMGCECVGLEVSKEYVEYSRKLGLKIYENWDELAKEDSKKFDWLLHYYVLEHMNKPLDFLKECFTHIIPGGKMLFEVPNGNDPIHSLYHVPEFDSFYWWRAHHWYFTPKSLKYLLEKFGRPYEIFPGQRYDLSNHINWMLTGKPGGMGKYSHIFSKETEKSYAEDLKRSWNCDYLIAVIS